MTKIKNNELTHTSNSGTSNVVMASNGDVTTARDLIATGDLTVTGNDIKSSGATAITMSGSNVTVAGTLTSTGGFVGISSVCARNFLMNGEMLVSERATSFTSSSSLNNDDKYTLDQWILLSDGNDIVDVSQNTTVPTGALKSIGFDVETTNKKFGIFQPIEQLNCYPIIGGTASLSFKMKASAVDKLDSVKAAIISWDGTADTVTSDIVNAWGAEGTRPTLVSNWTYENANDSGTTGNFTPTTSWATYTLKNVSIDTAGAKNVGVFIWSDVTDTTAGQYLYITDVQLEEGSDTNPILRKEYMEQRKNCARYYERVTGAMRSFDFDDYYGNACYFDTEKFKHPSYTLAFIGVNSGATSPQDYIDVDVECEKKAVMPQWDRGSGGYNYGFMIIANAEM
tara:strand:- start:433 stop:1623 length:1191 start_codon:yes stop_codon:yes gene_type:complete